MVTESHVIALTIAEPDDMRDGVESAFALR
jgi:hypothetical protein